MHRRYLITIIAFASLVRSQASNVSESYPAASATALVSTENTDGATTTPVTESMLPSGSSVSESMTWSDATSFPTMTAGTASMADASRTQVQSATTTMSTSMGVASGNSTSSPANATNTTAASASASASASTTSVDKKNIAGQIRSFADIFGILVLIGIVAGL